MASRTQIFQQLPWDGGLNTSLDEAMIPVNQCRELDNVVYDFGACGVRDYRDGYHG
jgi:hypothetical protein